MAQDHKCPIIGDLFEDQQRWLQFAEFWNEFKNREMDIADFFAAVIEHQDLFWINARAMNHSEFRGRRVSPEVIGLEIKTAKWLDECSNSHVCPDGGVTNWTCTGDRPRGYPGVTGTVDLTVTVPKSENFCYHALTIFGAAKIKTGSGSGGGAPSIPTQPGRAVQQFSYGFTVFAHDVPGLWKHRQRYEEQERRQLVWKTVSGSDSAVPPLPNDWAAPDMPLLLKLPM